MDDRVAEIQAGMYQYSRAIYRSIKDLTDPYVDPATQLYYLADRSNKTIDVVDARRDVLVRQIQGGFKGFTGNNDTSGPNGVVVSGHWLFVTDAPSRIVTVDLRTVSLWLGISVRLIVQRSRRGHGRRGRRTDPPWQSKPLGAEPARLTD